MTDRGVYGPKEANQNERPLRVRVRTATGVGFQLVEGVFSTGTATAERLPLKL